LDRDSVDNEEIKKFIAFKQQWSCTSSEISNHMPTEICFEDLLLNDSHKLYNFTMEVTGKSTESEIFESLSSSNERTSSVQKALLHLYDFAYDSYCKNRKGFIDLVVTKMSECSEIISIQMAGIACLYRLAGNGSDKKIDHKRLEQVVESILNAMQLFPKHILLQKIALFALNNDSILRYVSFHRFKCIQLVLDSVVAFKKTSMNEKAVKICSILASKITTFEKSKLLAKPVYMNTLMDIVRSRIQLTSDHDFILKYTLSIIKSLTNESPKSYEMYINCFECKIIFD